MRVLLDISVLGLGHAYPEMRGGTFRVHEHLAEGLARSGRCELLLCANYSSVAFTGCVEYLRDRPLLGPLPLLRPPLGAVSGLGGLARAVHRSVRRLFPAGAPALLRGSARLVDGRLHAPVRDTAPPADVLHSLGARLPPPAAGGRSPKRLVNIYDLAPLRLPWLYGPRQRYLAEARLAGLCRDDWVITPSEATRTDLAELAGVDPDRVFVVPLAADARVFHPDAGAGRASGVRARLGLPEAPYLLALSGGDVRKNVVSAIRAFTRVVRETGARELAFVIVGPPVAERGADESLREAERAGARVVFAGLVGDAELAALYAGALAFVYPSLYEGFGLPPLEAMQCGTPVIAARASSLPEVVGDAGILVDPDDPDALCDAMARLHRDAGLRDRLRARSLERAARFSWARTVSETLAAYGAVTTGAAPRPPRGLP